MAQTVKITPATGLLEFIGDNVANKPVLQHDNAGNLTLTLQSAKKFTIGGNLKVNGKVTMAQQTLTDGAAITWDFNSGANAKVTIAGARTLVITNMEAGDTGLILVKQDAAGGRTLTLPGSSSIVGGGSYTASSAANATDVLGVYYDGTTYWWTIGYNTVTPPLTSVGITGSDFVIANSPLTSNGNIGLALATVNSNVGTFGSATAVPVITVNGKGLVTAVSATNISIPTNLDSLTDVTISLAATGQLLQFNGSQWVNWTPNYVPTSRTLSINGTSYDLSANRDWTIDTVSYVSRVQHGVKAAVAINKGQAVYVTSADGTNMIVSLASNGSEATSSKTMGLLDATVAINGMANVVTEGLLAGLDTSLAGTEGDPVWLGDNGNLIYGLPNKPYAPRHLVFIGIVTRKNANNGEIFVKVQNGFELKEIHDVDLITTVPVNGHILGYDGTLWVNKTIAGWLGFTPANDANVVHTTGNESIAGIKTFSGTTQATSTSTGTIVTAGGVGIAKNLYVGGDVNVVGNLIIGGTTTTVYAQNLTVSDNMIYLNNGIATTITNAVGNGSSVVYTTQETHNYVTGMSVTITGVTPSAYNLSNQTITAVSANSFTIANSATGTYSSGGTARAKTNANPDLGFAAGYNDGSYAHAGLFRDATDNTWKFFKGYTPEPDTSPFIDTSHASFAYADLRADNITGRSFIKVGGVSTEFLKADGSVDSNTYLTTGAASSTYQPLDADLTAIAALATTGFLKRTGANTWSLDSNTYLTSYTETDTLATVTGRGATTSTAVTFSGGATISTLALNGATTSAEASLFLGAHSTTEGGQLVLQKGTSSTYATHLDNFTDSFRILYGTNTGSAGVALTLSMSTRQLTLPAYTTSSSFSGTAVGWLAFDASGNIITVAAPTGAVTSVNAGTGVSVNSTTGAVTVSIGQSVATSASPTFNQVLTTNNGSGTNVKIGDDVWIGDVNNANTLGIVGQHDATAGYITFGSELSNKLGRTGTGDLTWGGNRIWHAGNLTNLNQLTNGPGYLTSAIISATAGSGISVSTSAGNLNIVNTGLLSATAGSGITVSTSGGNLNIVNSGLLSATAGSGITVSTSGGNLNIVNTITNTNQLTNGAGYITQATADSRYVDISGDMMNGNLYIYPAGNQAQLQLVGTNPELYVSASAGTSRVFINRAASGNQATLMFTTGMNVVPGVAWDYTGVPMWTLGMTNNNNTDSFKIAYGDIYDPNSVALEITSANVAYFRSVPYGGGSLLATQAWVTGQINNLVAQTRTLTINGTSYDLSANRSWSVGTVTSVGLSSATSGVTIGSTPITTSGTITLAIATASGSQQGLLSSTDWTTFNNKQNALTNPVTATGSRSTNYLPKFTSSNEITESNIQDNGALVQVGTDANWKGFKVFGDSTVTGNTFMYSAAYAYNGLTTYGNLQSNGYTYLYDTTYLYGNAYAYNPMYVNGVYDIWDSNYYLYPSGTSSFNSTSTGIANSSYGKIKIDSSTFNGGLFGSPSITETISAPSSYNVPTKYFKVQYIWGTYTYGAWQGSDFRWYNNMQVYQNLFADKFISYGFSDNGTGAKLQIQGNGYIRDNFLIGTTTNAGYKLDVNGTTRIIGNLTATSFIKSGGTSSQFLKADGSVDSSTYLPLSGGTITGTVNFSNNNIEGVGHIIMADSGFGEGIQWENWFICDAPDDSSNQAGNLQFVYVPDNAVRMTFDTGGTLTLSNRLVELSSIRYKTNVESLTPALDKVLQLRPVYYTKISGTDGTEIGLIAEEVAEIYPELIKYNEAGQVDGINYTRIAPILIKTIQEQQELIKKLTKRIDDLENR